MIAAGGFDKTLSVWDVSTNTPLAVFSGQNDRVTSVAFSSDGHTLASGSRDGTVNLWDLSNLH